MFHANTQIKGESHSKRIKNHQPDEPLSYCGNFIALYINSQKPISTKSTQYLIVHAFCSSATEHELS